jgi:hypothetical protein
VLAERLQGGDPRDGHRGILERHARRFRREARLARDREFRPGARSRPEHLVARRERRHGAADSLDAAREIRAHGRRRGSAKAAAPHEELVDLAEAFLPRISPEEFPYLIEHAQQHLLPPDPAEKPEFEFGLDLILDGRERLRDVEQA